MTDCDGLITNLRNANNAARIDLDAIKARAAAATPGPWSAADEHGNWPGATPAWCVSRMDGGKYLYDVFYHASQSDGPQAERDSEFIAAARADVPALVAEVERLRADNERIWADAVQQQQLADNAHTYDLDVLRAEVERLRAIEARP